LSQSPTSSNEPSPSLCHLSEERPELYGRIGEELKEVRVRCAFVPGRRLVVAGRGKKKGEAEEMAGGWRLEARRSSLSSVRPRVPLPIFRQPLDTIAVHR
jgi:hypothetical protein